MKKETAEARLNALFGLTDVAQEVKAKTTGRVMGITEDEIQEFREIQGLIYFLQAPALFEEKFCKHCGSFFVVSRKYVAYCSYTCISKSLEELGIKWTKGKDLEALAEDTQVWDGNEPIWIREPLLTKLQTILTHLSDSTLDKDETLSPSPVQKSPSDTASPSMMEKKPLSSSGGSPTTPSTTSTPGISTSRTKKPERKITFNT